MRIDNSCSFIYLHTVIYQQFRTRCHTKYFTKYELRRVLVNSADLECPMAQSSLEGPPKAIVFYHLGSMNRGKMFDLLKSALNVALFHLLT